MTLNRRTFVRALTTALLTPAAWKAWAMPLLTGREPDAVTLGYVKNAASVDRAAEPAYQPGDRCARCYFYQGSRDSPDAPCTIFAGWRVSSASWCRQFTARNK